AEQRIRAPGLRQALAIGGRELLLRAADPPPRRKEHARLRPAQHPRDRPQRLNREHAATLGGTRAEAKIAQVAVAGRAAHDIQKLGLADADLVMPGGVT